MSVGSFRPKAHDHLRTMKAKAAHDVTNATLSNRVDLLDLLQPAVRVIEHFQEADAEVGGGVAKLQLPNITQPAKVAGAAPIPQPGAASGHGDQRDTGAFGGIPGDSGGAAEAFVVGMRHHHHQALAVARHREQV